jgi:segregation and condensation protein B
MSLKAKIEAVIYASEEPVTLAQLLGLLGDEAQAELDCAVSAQQTLSLNETENGLEEAAEATPTLLTDLDLANAEPVAETGSPATPGSAEAPSDLDAGDASGAPATEPNPQTAEPSDSAADSATDSSATDAAAVEAAAARAERARLARLRAHFRVLLDQLIAEYSAPESDRGLEIREVGGGFRFATKPEYHDAVRGFVRTLKPPLKLTLQSLETLAVVAYKQPVTAPEISEIRGVDSSGVLGSLLARKLIATAGRKHVIGRPILYKTTREFLLKFGLKDVSELPSIEEFEKMAGQLAEQEEMAMEHEPSAPHEKPVPPETAEEQSEPEPEGEASTPEPVADEVIVDGRLSGLPPVVDDAADDPSAAEAEIQESGESL